MNIVTILGSPRTDGNTDRLLDWTERALKDWRHNVTRMNLADLTVHGCKSCFACTESVDEPGCVVLDDAPAVFEKMIEADAILFATPLYMWGYASQLKALLDRSICLVRDMTALNTVRSLLESRLLCSLPVPAQSRGMPT